MMDLVRDIFDSLSDGDGTNVLARESEGEKEDDKRSPY